MALNLPPNGRRLIFDLGRYGLPEIPYLAAQNLPFTSTGLPMHTHKERMEISHILKGERVYCVGGKSYHLRGGDVFITYPDEMHGSGSYLHGRGLHFWMQAVVPAPGSSFLRFDAERAEPLLRALRSMPRRQFKADAGMRDIFARILSICREEPSELAGVELSALLTQWFLLLARASARESGEEIPQDIARTLEIMSRVPYRHVTIAELAEAACLSESRFKGKFREIMGVPPGEYLLRRRTEMAGEMLARRRLSLTEIAIELGFSSAQHFSQTFKKFFGLSPNAWLLRQGAGDEAGSAKHADSVGTGVRPWTDAGGLLHGYVDKSYRGGSHPIEER